MKNEFELINTIKNLLNSNYIGDDCAYLEDLGIVITQDSLIEDIHFKRSWCTPYQLGFKAVTVNISDILASGAIPKYLTVGLSLPNSVDNEFVTHFYQGAMSALGGAQIIGGDITGSKNDIAISITAVGTTDNRYISSRKNAKEDYIIITKGNHGTSALGLCELQNNGNNNELIKAHLEPQLEFEFANMISTTVNEPYAMMDTSDGIADALFKIAEASDIKIIINYNKIPHLNIATQEQVLFGGEDYKLVAAIPKKYLQLISNADVIGYAAPYDGIRLDISGKKYTNYNELSTYNHFN